MNCQLTDRLLCVCNQRGKEREKHTETAEEAVEEVTESEGGVGPERSKQRSRCL